jgi:hypothetical protein
MKKIIWTCGLLYAAAWITHLYIGTVTLRGFFGDGALAFLIHLSTSYVFNTDSQWVHLFSVGFPRDTQLFLNALGLQFALWAHVTDPLALKYTFVFWQFALPGFLYLLLFAVMVRCNKMSWIIYPLISWAILSVPVDWNAVNSTRWAVPTFWMHFVLILFAGPKIQKGPLAAAIILGAAMWGGLYESVVLHCALCLGFGAALWWKENNRTPFLYALASVPGMARAAFDFIATGHAAPNGHHRLIIADFINDPFCLLIACAFVFALLLATFGKKIPRHFIALIFIILAATIVNIFVNPLLSVWVETEMKFDYVLLSAVIMVWMGTQRVLLGKNTPKTALASCMVLLVGTVLWMVQIQQSLSWKNCIDTYEANRGNKTLLFDPQIQPLYKRSEISGTVDRITYGQCLWDWATPWADLLLTPNGQIKQWTYMTFWQNFDFVEKDGTTYLHTNNWSLTTPTFQPDEGYLPLKTLLYDITPLFQRVGLGQLAPRARCQNVEDSGGYWHDYLASLSDADRRLLFVCPRQDIGTSP